jgi:two-component system nitrate/nitrite response regulator NarL
MPERGVLDMEVSQQKILREQRSLRLFIIVATRLYREGLAEVLAHIPSVAGVMTATGWADTVPQVRQFAPHIALLDMSLSESLEIVRGLGRLTPSIRVVGLAMPETERDMLACAEAGIAGYLPRDGSLDDLVTTLRHVARGETVCSPHMAAVLLRRVANLTVSGDGMASPVRLTRREQEIAGFLAAGLANRHIARELGIEVCTVKNHVHSILEKLGARNRHQVARFSHLYS